MILSKTIKIKLCSSTINYYKNKGYDLSLHMHKDKKGKMVYILGAEIEVNVSDLPPRSVKKVLAKCDNCGKERLVEFDKYTPLCHKCALQTETYKINNGNANRGKRRTSEQRERLKRPNHLNRGKNSSKWNENKTEEERKQQNIKSRSYVEYKAWRIFVFRKDGYQCQRCGYTGKDINAHHIESYFTNEKLKTDINNGIVFCKNCHKLFHSTYGKTGNNRDQLNEFISNREEFGFVKKEYINKFNRQGSKNINNNNYSIYVGVSRKNGRSTWTAQIYCNGERYYLGSFKYEIEAALAYNNAALELLGWKANINQISQEEIDILWQLE